jgi:flavin reductase ActVB
MRQVVESDLSETVAKQLPNESGTAGHTRRPSEEAQDEFAAGDGFREAMRRLPAGVVAITCHVNERPWGVTATACCSISTSPPLIMASLTVRTVAAGAIERSRRFGVSVLGSRTVHIARAASEVGRPKFVEHYCLRDDAPQSLTPMIADAQAHLDCTVTQVHTVADHLLFIGEVRAVVLHEPDQPLVYCAKNYHGVRLLADAPNRSGKVR